MSKEKGHGLGEWEATAICGNDITSSCLYVSALSIMYAGQWAWVSLLMVSVVLYFYRSIYGEVVGALPLNGGAYNALLNTTSKTVASLAATYTLLSYMATAVISANEAMNYLSILWQDLPILMATVILLAVFMVLSIFGIGESAKVALGIFILHITSVSVLIVVAAWGLSKNGLGVFSENLHAPIHGSLPMALFFGFSAAMLGISGFESSANFVEEQQAGVFPKTLRNMWIAVTVINPLIAFLALAVLPLSDIGPHTESLLSYMGGIAGGSWLSVLIAVDATLVLSGAVLTSFVGVTGLVHRMVLDRCLPQFLLKENKFKTQYRIVVAFFILSVSVLAVTRGSLTALAGVYTVAFLSVMVLFGIGNLLLKIRRSELRRPVSASWLGVIFAITAVFVALLGNIYMNPNYVVIFSEYFIPAVTVVIIMLNRIALLNACLFFIKALSNRLIWAAESATKIIQQKIDEINSQEIVFFTRGENIANLNLAMLYVRNNEHAKKVRIVTVIKEGAVVPPNLKGDIAFLDRVYDEIDIDFVVLTGTFNPAFIHELSEQWSIPTNFMFIATPRGKLFTYTLAELGGVRLII
ncbi:MAG TPA: APC family permease [Desulfosporosinus sp.]|nr:APC family permease [Desulfosporosinus sp.]